MERVLVGGGTRACGLAGFFPPWLTEAARLPGKILVLLILSTHHPGPRLLSSCEIWVVVPARVVHVRVSAVTRRSASSAEAGVFQVRNRMDVGQRKAAALLRICGLVMLQRGLAGLRWEPVPH